MCDKTVDNYLHPLKFVSECYKTQKISEKAVDTHPSTIQFVPKYYKTHEICGIAVSLYLIIYRTDKYKTQKCVLKLLMIV